jgi:hypothetical protein
VSAVSDSAIGAGVSLFIYGIGYGIGERRSSLQHAAIGRRQSNLLTFFVLPDRHVCYLCRESILIVNCFYNIAH